MQAGNRIVLRDKIIDQQAAEIAALKAQLAGKAHNHCAYCGCVTHRRLKAEIAALRELVKQVLADHADPQSPYYNDCDAPNIMCDWCGQATKALEATK